MTNDELKEHLLRFTIRVNREVCIRTKEFKPATEDEARQAEEGLVHCLDLDAVQEEIP